MLAKQGDKAFDSEEWIFEIKWDGYRAIAEIGKTQKLYSRNGLSFEQKFSPIFDMLKQQKHDMILDGEIIALDEKGMPNFQLLQHFDPNISNTILQYQVFDLLELNGKSTLSLSLIERKELLKKALVENDLIKYCSDIETRGKDFFNAAVKKNLEGIMAKKKSSIYVPGKRSQDWLKIRNHQIEEAVIVGFTAPRGSRKKFGALILGKFIDGKLIYSGHTGTGFDEQSLKDLFSVMESLIVQKSPFETVPKTNEKPTWIKPKLIANIKYTEITKDGIYRHPVFMGLRDDKKLKDIIMKNEKTDDKDQVISFGRKQVKLTNTDKIYWPKENFTKGDLINYYNEIQKYILPFLKDRPQSLNRFPNGIDKPSFYHKDAGENAPSWVKTFAVYSESSQREIDYIICNDAATLLYLANLGCIEMNPWNSTIKKPDFPTYMIIDIDPSKKNNFDQVIEAALATKQVLDEMQVPSYCKTSGSTGMHVFIPLGNKYDFDQVKLFGQIVAQKVVELIPDFATIERSLSKRSDSKIYIDFLQNRRGQTIASAYSVRPKPEATVSTPLDWKEVKKGLSPQNFTIKNIGKRLEKIGEIFHPVLEKGIDLKKILGKIQ